jgi:NADH pyrophosphatase NudC (nudix superfamily)
LSDPAAIIALTSLLAIVVIAFVLRIRPQDLPPVEPVSPFIHLDERKAAIYENLRDLQFEYRVGKLSDADYQSTKTDLQKELAAVLAEVDRVKEQLSGKGAAAVETAANRSQAAANTAKAARVCPSCGANFERELKFCGECGKAMTHA